ncbi:hypothetical protein K7G90_000055 [Pasteurella canis]|uniref:hypothetical protein n=1 Tax=Pasteurella canis TaxID=753 RepID=UPI000A521B5D|nr:hypothetical protein [Pasteurella canis]MXN88215.1 hypothetical protein [Pasteurella canis]UAX42271.1 hypothetical protein K7G89_000055 [Pasteurella canis]UAY77823.1 hypothetical protein K7G90_000055 [Pasteurella canis]UEA16918.1 hypothetical protein K7G92_000060 [Pasteurella canis]
MFSWKKVFFYSLIMIFAVIVLFAGGMFVLSNDAKDRCLDYGGHYNEVTRICEQ